MSYTEAHKKATLKYRKASRSRMELEMSPEEMDAINILAEKTGESRTALIKRLVAEESERIGVVRTLGYRNNGKRWEWWKLKDLGEGEDTPNCYYCTNDDGEGVFFVNSRANSRKQLAGTCEFSLSGIKDPRGKIRRYMNA